MQRLKAFFIRPVRAVWISLADYRLNLLLSGVLLGMACGAFQRGDLEDAFGCMLIGTLCGVGAWCGITRTLSGVRA